jgi:hypothetical protein
MISSMDMDMLIFIELHSLVCSLFWIRTAKLCYCYYVFVFATFSNMVLNKLFCEKKYIRVAIRLIWGVRSGSENAPVAAGSLSSCVLKPFFQIVILFRPHMNSVCSNAGDSSIADEVSEVLNSLRNGDNSIC